jgi:hypothetical protein
MKKLAFGMALVIAAVGAVGILVPSALQWLGPQTATSGAFYFIAVVRVVFGLILISVAPVSRAPKTLRVLGYVILLAGVATALTGLVAIEHARTVIDWWLHLGSGVIRLTGVFLAAFGGFIAYACAPGARAST